MQDTFKIKNMDSLDTRDAKMPAELVKAFYDLKITSILDIACGSGWLCDYMPPGTRYFGFDPNPTAIENALKLHPEGNFMVATIRDILDKTIMSEPCDAAFLKCVFCVVKPDPTEDIVQLIKRCVTKYVMLYDTELKAGYWSAPFTEAGFTLMFTHTRGGMVTNNPENATYAVSHAPSSVQIWRVDK